MIISLVDLFFRIANRIVELLFGSYISERQKLQSGDVKEHYSPRVHLHWQNLNDSKHGEPDGVPYKGRCWIWFRGFGKLRENHIGFEWNFWHPRWLFSFRFAVKSQDLSFGVGIWPFSFHLHIDRFFGTRFNEWWFKKYRYGGREFWLYATCAEEVAGWFNVVGHLWADPMEGGGRRKGWRRFTEFFWSFPDVFLSPVFGKLQHSEETLEERSVNIPLPEGLYEGKAELRRAKWKRPRLPWASLVRHDSWVDIPIGIPYEGKGENSWDCGEDGVFGMGCQEPSYPALVAKVVEHVLDRRRKYDGNMDAKYPSPEVRKAAFEKRRSEALLH